jgi:hypothetical protein
MQIRPFEHSIVAHPFSDTGKHAKIGLQGGLEHLTILYFASQKVPGGQNLSAQSKEMAKIGMKNKRYLQLAKKNGKLRISSLRK